MDDSANDGGTLVRDFARSLHHSEVVKVKEAFSLIPSTRCHMHTAL